MSHCIYWIALCAGRVGQQISRCILNSLACCWIKGSWCNLSILTFRILDTAALWMLVSWYGEPHHCERRFAAQLGCTAHLPMPVFTWGPLLGPHVSSHFPCYSLSPGSFLSWCQMVRRLPSKFNWLTSFVIALLKIFRSNLSVTSFIMPDNCTVKVVNQNINQNKNRFIVRVLTGTG